ncbi:MAG: hypothetical protein QG552_2524 [Thermodesulfobacteriota bacterium]|nr:hypothetical protein [Thermodesulfobacteriota bacterium]
MFACHRTYHLDISKIQSPRKREITAICLFRKAILGQIIPCREGCIIKKMDFKYFMDVPEFNQG